MNPTLLETAFALLRLSLDAESKCSVEQRLLQHPLSKEDWLEIYQFAQKQTIIGVMLVGIHKLPEELLPPDEILDDWTSDGFYIHQQNIKMNDMCAKVTKMFMDRGLHPVILKGQANARLYPDPLSRQCGDIDVLVEGGKKNVIRHLKEMGLMEGADTLGFHHIHLDSKFFDGIPVEVHFKPVDCMPIGTGKRLQQFLLKKAEWENCLLVPEGFYVPPMEFALLMQLSHIRRHFIGGGIGLRQLVDYFLLLRNAEFAKLTELCEKLEEFGLKSAGSALMWPLKQIFLLENQKCLCPPNEFWGTKLKNDALNGGNFGRSDEKWSDSTAKRWFGDRKRKSKLCKFDFLESIWTEICYWKTFANYTPERIRQRKLSLRK